MKTIYSFITTKSFPDRKFDFLNSISDFAFCEADKSHNLSAKIFLLSKLILGILRRIKDTVHKDKGS